LAELVKAAQAEGVLNVTWAGAMGGAESVKVLEEGMNRKYGIKIRIVHQPGPTMSQLAARHIQETKSGRKTSFDLFVSSESHPPRLMEADIAEAVPWSKLFPYITPQMQEFGGRTVRVSTSFRGVYYNTRLVRPDEVPHKIDDVFKPQWKGKIASTLSAAQFDRLAILKGVEETKAIVRKTAEWAGGLVRCPDEGRVATGEFILLFMSCSDGSKERLQAEGAPIDHALLEDALLLGYNYLTMLKNSEHPNLARLLVGFSLSKEGQTILDRFGYGLHLVEGTKRQKLYQQYTKRGLKFLESTAEETPEKLPDVEKLREELQNIIQKKY
jgi:iron(III) transport system substrate-binding protein